MTLRTIDKLVCECGHEGLLRSKENDQPYSSEWTSHKLEGFSGTVSKWQLDGVHCPACGKTGKVDYAKQTHSPNEQI